MHIKFCCELYLHQLKVGRYFLHEHPQSATSWDLPCIKEVLASKGVEAVITHMCQFGMTSKDDQGREGSVLKPTRFMTNSACILLELDRKCKGGHVHTQLVGGRAKAAQVYPPDL